MMDFRQPYDRGQWLGFLDGFLPEDFSQANELIPVESGLDPIKTVTLIGESRSLELPVYEIRHTGENDPRVSLSKGAFRILAQYGQKRGLVLFTSKGRNYRFSLVTIDLKMEGKRTTKEYSNPRRYSFFLGPDCKAHTPAQYLSKRVQDFDDLKNRFSIEVVNKEFYSRIAELFTVLVGGQRKIGSRSMDERGILALPQMDDDRIKKEFAVRLIGRLIFCWFLKKKRSQQGIPLVPDELLASLKAAMPGVVGGYYHGILEPLFFEILNNSTNQREPEYQKSPWNLIPFLNGGLFTPHEHDYYEKGPMGLSIHINTLIVADGWLKDLLAVFEEYNFTIDENTPVDIELSIEPEMLGRIFENLLAEINPETGETARKATGSYYTPRPIVEYMVDESIKHFLETSTGIDEERIAPLLVYATDTDETFSTAEKVAIVDALHKVKVLDPACGSGAFPMGILQKILLILQKLDPDSSIWLDKLLDSIPDPMYRKELKKKKIPNYIHKLGIIRDCIFGIDIQPIAVEISKLRCFLSLVVDEKVNDNADNRGIEHLPNLEFKFVCANSLLDLPKSQAIQAKKKGKKVTEFIGQGMMFEATDEIKELKRLREEYLGSFGNEKESIEGQFVKIQQQLRKHTVNRGAIGTQTALLADWNPFGDEICPWFDPEWMFGIASGFDIVIANPPYVRQGLIKDLKPVLAQQYRCYDATADLYIYFYERAVQLIKTGGSLAFITTNKYFRSGYGEKLRAYLSEQTTLRHIIDFGDAPVFEAIAYPSILILTKNPGAENNSRVMTWKPGPAVDDFVREFRDNGFLIPQKELTADGWRLESSSNLRLLEKLRNTGKPLGEYVGGRFYYGIKTGFNEAFVVDRATRDRLIAEHKSSAEVLKPFLRGRDVKRWRVEPQDLWLVFTRRGIEIEKYPAIHKHLYQFKKQLLPGAPGGRKPGSYKWYEIQDNVAYWQEFEQPKIIFGCFMYKPTYAFDSSGFYHNNALYFASRLTPYMAAFLNSPVVWFFLRKMCTDLQNGYLQALIQYQEQIPIPATTPEKQAELDGLVKKVSSLTGGKNPENDVKALERQINQKVYALYGLSDEEIEIVERSENR